MKSAKLLGPRDTVVLLPTDQDVILGRGTHNIPATDKRCSRQSIKVRYDSKTPNTIQITQLGVNPGIIQHGSPQESYMTKDTTYYLLDGQKMTVLMHDYEFTASIPKPASSEASSSKPATTATVSKNMDWMADSVEEETKKPSSSETFATSAPVATKTKPLCIHGVKCYRKNPDHFAAYAHPHLEAQKAANTTKSAPSPTPGPSSASSAPSSTASTSTNLSAMDVTTEKPVVAPEVPKAESSSKMDVSPPSSSSNTSSAPESSTTRDGPAMKRPMPALDLMDDEENFLPASKKPKKASSMAPSIAKSSSTNDWLGEEETETKISEIEGSKKAETSPLPAALTSSSPSSKPIDPARPPQVSKASSSQGSTSTESKATKVESSPSLEKLPILKKPSDVTASAPSQDQTVKLKSSCAKDWDALEAVLKLEAPKTTKRAIVLSHLGRSYEAQEAVVMMVEIVEKYLKQLSSSSSVKVWYWADSPVSATLFRKTQMTGSDANKFVLCPPESTIAETLQKIQEENTEEVVIVTDANWRFKGNGKADSFNVLLHQFIGPSLSSDAKALYNVGTEACAYPVAIKHGNHGKNGLNGKSASTSSQASPSSFPALKYVIHVVDPAPISTASGTTSPSGDLLRQAFCSAIASFVQLP